MRKTFSILAFTFCLSACGPTDPTVTSTEPGNHTHEAIDTAAIHSQVQPTEHISMLDSIDKANNESVAASGDDITKAFIGLSRGDSTIHLTANIRQDHRIFGYAQPDINSERLLLLSVFTNDAENNPFGCKLGAYYQTNGMDGLTLKYLSINGNFVEATATDKSNHATTLYFEKKWIDFE